MFHTGLDRFRTETWENDLTTAPVTLTAGKAMIENGWLNGQRLKRRKKLTHPTVMKIFVSSNIPGFDYLEGTYHFIIEELKLYQGWSQMYFRFICPLTNTTVVT